MRGVLFLAAAALLAAACAAPAATATPTPAASPTPAPSGATFSVANGTTVPVAIAVNGTVVETVPAGTTEDPIKAPVPPRPWTVEARSPSGRVLATMTVAANDYLSSTSGRIGSADLACGTIVLWAGAPYGGGPSSVPDPSKPCDPAPEPGAPSASAIPGERVVGGWAVLHERPGVAGAPSLTAAQAVAVVRREVEAGRARIQPAPTAIPRMPVLLGASFSPALLDVVNPAGSSSFRSKTPVAAWVVVLQGEGADWTYTTLGVVDDRTGRPLDVEVWTPGAG